MLPEPGCRMVASRKMEILDHLRRHPEQTEEVMRRYSISQEELEQWRRGVEAHGPRGLHVTRVQQLPRPRSS